MLIQIHELNVLQSRALENASEFIKTDPDGQEELFSVDDWYFLSEAMVCIMNEMPLVQRHYILLFLNRIYDLVARVVFLEHCWEVPFGYNQ